MECHICTQPYDLAQHMPLVLGCGHTFCHECLEHAFPQGPVTCFVDRKEDARCVALLPRNMAHIDAHRLDLQQLLAQSNGISIGSSLFVDERELALTDKELGSGATGRVVEATFRGRPVAVKVVDLSDALPAVCAALQREASVVLAVSGECRHACQYKGATLKGSKFCLIMKRYSKSLARVTAEAGGLPLPQLLRYGAQIGSCCAGGAAWPRQWQEQRVVLGDLKPQNLLLDDDLDKLTETDFGLSRIVSHTVGGYRPSQSAAGTPNYMCPEQYDIDAEGNPTMVTPAIDLWAWACCMSHMATCLVPFGRLNPQQIMMHVGVQRTAPPVPAELPGPLQQLMQQCLAVSPSQRPSAKQALQALRVRSIVDAAAVGAHQELEAVLVLTQPSPLTKRLLLRYQPEQQLQQLKQQLLQQALPAILQQRAARQQYAAALGTGPGRLLVLGMDAQSLAQLNPLPGKVSLPEIPCIHQHARRGEELQLLLALALFGADINELIPASGCSVLDAALQCHHLELATKLLQLHGSSLSTRVLLNALPRMLELQAWRLAEDVTGLMEQRTGTKQQAGSATFYVTEPAALSAAPQLLRRLKAAGALPVVQKSYGKTCSCTPDDALPTHAHNRFPGSACVPPQQCPQAGAATFYVTEPAALSSAPQLLRRLKAAGALPVVLAKVLHDAEMLRLAVQLDPQHLSRTIKAQQCCHMFNAYAEAAAGSLTYLHQACGFHLTSWEGSPPADLELARLAVSLADDVDAQQRHIFKADSYDVKDYERPCCMNCLSSHSNPGPCVCVKFSNMRYTPLHMAVLHGCQYRWPRGLLKDCLPLQGCGSSSSSQRISYDRMVAAARAWLPIASMLIDAGADVSREYARGRTPLSLLQAAIAAAEALGDDEQVAAELGVEDSCKELLTVLRGWEDRLLGSSGVGEDM
ncbi:hypothetical protein OEZ86_013570 [Tetradesmus obliquus]|nr:hypothetical protein OEZ86_013570 [Tetradesmus obliquus]